ncbi:hypothetical protein RAB80_017571 [Fusarium oxysporum f. sp. vasinfectum]|uniref:Uncharacterized protein n=1 Tax=Fusarium oxysporum f. sp. vasinfectum 25433 TaxID=1089449 RepID=X0KP89_FUSOX|nr:hypothetical protein FOTG_16249 [Fusarium oxysporum f. sp. vasinfectum 25433]KAK2667150.1 hypothetical protein RAB80_017571 [Fusarium oxysporum f. sp. vasinfectum]KAK2922708.1 hypothetical protein FoTM2_017561 [Fusarium oxysporum f. sp. vasinfectum]
MTRQFNGVLADSWLGLLNFDSTTNARVIGSTLPTTLDSNQGQGQALRGQPGDEQDTITRLIKIETMLKWICDNQFKLLEKYIDIEQRIETMRNSLEEQRGCIKDSLDYVLANSESR